MHHLNGLWSAPSLGDSRKSLCIGGQFAPIMTTMPWAIPCLSSSPALFRRVPANERLIAPSRLARVKREQDGGCSSRAFTLLEIVIVVAIVFVLAYIAIPTALHAAYRSQVTRAIKDIEAIASDIDVYELQTGQVPADLSEINRDELKDPWGRPYVYLSFAAVGPSWRSQARKDRSLVPVNSRFDLYSMGKDGRTLPPLTTPVSQDDIVRANDGGFVGLGSDY